MKIQFNPAAPSRNLTLPSKPAVQNNTPPPDPQPPQNDRVDLGRFAAQSARVAIPTALGLYAGTHTGIASSLAGGLVGAAGGFLAGAVLITAAASASGRSTSWMMSQMPVVLGTAALGLGAGAWAGAVCGTTASAIAMTATGLAAGAYLAKTSEI